MASPFEKREAEPDSEAENGYAESEAEDDPISEPEDPYAESESEPEIEYYEELDVKGEWKSNQFCGNLQCFQKL